MASGFLSSWLGRGQPLPPEIEEARAELQRLAEQRPSFAAPSSLLCKLLPHVFGVTSTETIPLLDGTHAATKLAGGIPLLRGESLALDFASSQERLAKMLRVVEQGQFRPFARALSKAVQLSTRAVRDFATEILAGRADTILTWAEQQACDADLTSLMIRLALLPLFHPIQSAWTPLRQGTRWQQGYCPICGSWPLLGEFRGLEQTRFLRCGWCAADWEFPRLSCPFCGAADHRVLGYFHVEDEAAQYRAATCEECRNYVKIVSTLTALTPVGLLVKDAATLHLDLAALERGYFVGSA